MRISGTAGVVVALMALAVVGGGTYFFRTVQGNRKLELQAQIKKMEQETKAAEAKTKDSEAKAKEADARKKEAERKRAEAEAEKKKAELAAKKQEAANLKEKTALAEAERKRAVAAKAAADAETAKSEAAKVAADAAWAAQEKRAAAETIARDREQAEQKKAEAQLAEKLAVQKIAEAALAKSENERKTAEATAAAEHDRKLRMYNRASTSRAEMVALQRAERLLALEESGALGAAAAEIAAEGGKATEPAADAEAEKATPTNAVVAVTWPDAESAETPAGAKVVARQKKLDERRAADHLRQARRHIDSFGVLVEKAVAENRATDARYYRSTLATLVPDYVEIYEDLVDEARKAGDAKAEAKRLDELVALVPDWQRVAVFVQLLRRDEAYYSRALAGRVGKDEYVKAFRKIYDEALRDKGDRDERMAKAEHVCKVLATYVPDYERSPEWK